MKALVGCSGILLLAAGVSAQTVTRGFGSVVFPGGTAATTPGATRNFGSVVFPGGSVVPAVRTAPVMMAVPRGVAPRPAAAPATGQNFRRTPAANRFARPNTLVYAYPVFVGGGYDNSLVGSEPPPPETTMSYPRESARPVMIQVAPDYAAHQGFSVYQPSAPESAAEPAPSSERYLLAFKDHTVYSAVAYWFDGDTLHYFTSGSVHNQASVSLIDRDLTTRLNKDLGIDFHMPAAK